MFTNSAPLADQADGQGDITQKSERSNIALDRELASAPVAIASRPAMIFAAGVAALAIMPLWRMVALLDNLDLALTTAVVFGAAGCHLWHFVPPRQSAGAWTMLVAGAAVLLGTWQLAWIAPEDFWLVRLMVAVAGVAMAALWCGVARGWRAVTAIMLWVGWLQLAHALEVVFSSAWICESTAALAGWLLWQCGQDVSLQGAAIHLTSGAVRVGGPCTGVPLALLLLVLLAIAGLLLRLTRWQMARIAALSIGLAFLIGVMRVALLAVVVADAERFGYWHSPPGAAWFSALSIVWLAWIVSRVPREVARFDAAARKTAFVPVGLRYAPWPIAAVALAGFSLGEPAMLLMPPSELTAAEWPGATLVARTSKQSALPPRPHNHIQWRHDLTYAIEGQTGRLHIMFAAVPLLLAADPRAVVDAPAWMHAETGWQSRTVSDAMAVWTRAEEGRRTWAGAFTADGRAILDQASWRRSYLAGFRDPGRWADWLLHRRALCDKRAFFLAVSWEGPQAGELASEAGLVAAFTAWQQRVRDVAAFVPTGNR